MQVGPEDLAIHPFGHVDQVVVIPIFAEKLLKEVQF
jgi:hypothetical protein